MDVKSPVKDATSTAKQGIDSGAGQLQDVANQATKVGGRWQRSEGGRQVARRSALYDTLHRRSAGLRARSYMEIVSALRSSFESSNASSTDCY